MKKNSGYERGFSAASSNWTNQRRVFDNVISSGPIRRRVSRSVLPILDTLLRLKNVGLSTLMRGPASHQIPQSQVQPIILFVPAPPPSGGRPVHVHADVVDPSQEHSHIVPAKPETPAATTSLSYYKVETEDFINPALPPPYERPAEVVSYEPLIHVPVAEYHVKTEVPAVAPPYQQHQDHQHSSAPPAFAPVYIAPHTEEYNNNNNNNNNNNKINNSVEDENIEDNFEKEYVSFPTMEGKLKNIDKRTLTVQEGAAVASGVQHLPVQ